MWKPLIFAGEIRKHWGALVTGAGGRPSTRKDASGWPLH